MWQNAMVELCCVAAGANVPAKCALNALAFRKPPQESGGARSARLRPALGLSARAVRAQAVEADSYIEPQATFPGREN